MNGLKYVFRTLTLLRIIIMLFIRSTPNCDFVTKNHQKRIRLKRHFKLCFLLIGSYNTNIGPQTTNTTLTTFVIYTNIMLALLLFLRSITMQRSLTFPRIKIRRKMAGLLGADAIGIKTWNLQRQ
jgi:hypothetical protein